MFQQVIHKTYGYTRTDKVIVQDDKSLFLAAILRFKLCTCLSSLKKFMYLTIIFLFIYNIVYIVIRYINVFNKF